MTHPLTPREKVRQIIDGALNSAIPEPWEVANHATDAILTALASGSGDHAELARLADIADWMADGDPGANGSVLLSASVASEHAADLKAILAENAALRAERDDYFGMANRSEDAWHKAERKLAEAVGLLREWMGTWFVDADSREENAIADDTRKFLSKEAERG
jgi:hypothetical protein